MGDRNARLGPDAKIIDEEDYVDDEVFFGKFCLCENIYSSLKKYDLTPDYAGIRPKIKNTSGEFCTHFYIKEEIEFGLPGWFNLLGIESPGLTSSLAIGEKVTQILNAR